MLKILRLIRSCGECSNYGYYSGRASECKLTEQIVTDKTRVAPFCPLPDFPSDIIACMETTIGALQRPNEYGIGFAILTHLARKLKAKLDPRGSSIALQLKDGKELRLATEYITAVDIRNEIQFIGDDNKTYKLHPDSQPPKLYVSVEVEGVKSEGGLWQNVQLQV